MRSSVTSHAQFYHVTCQVTRFLNITGKKSPATKHYLIRSSQVGSSYIIAACGGTKHLVQQHPKNAKLKKHQHTKTKYCKQQHGATKVATMKEGLTL